MLQSVDGILEEIQSLLNFKATDYTQLLKAKELLKDELQSIAGVKDIQDDTPFGNNEFIVDLKPKGEALGFTLTRSYNST